MSHHEDDIYDDIPFLVGEFLAMLVALRDHAFARRRFRKNQGIVHFLVTVHDVCPNRSLIGSEITDNRKAILRTYYDNFQPLLSRATSCLEAAIDAERRSAYYPGDDGDDYEDEFTREIVALVSEVKALEKKGMNTDIAATRLTEFILLTAQAIDRELDGQNAPSRIR